jgi:hypothetical protein
LERDQIFLYRESQTYTTQLESTSQEKLREFYIRNNIRPEQEPAFEAIIHDQVREGIKASLDHAGTAVGIPPEQGTCILVAPPSKKPQIEHGDETPANKDPADIPERSKLAGLVTTKEKVECMIRICKQRSDLGSQATKNAIDFCKKYVNPVLNCLERHLKGNVDSFCETHKHIQHTTFKSKNCCGEQGTTTCSPKKK